MKNYRYIERRNQMIRRIGFWVAEVIGCIVLAFLVIQFCVQTITIHGDSMQPEFNDGDRVIVNKLDYRIGNPERFDVAVFEMKDGDSNYYTVKRVIGLPGETLQIVDGKVLINGEVLETGFVEDILSAGVAAYSIEIGENEYFVMGDNCNNSEDSRIDNIGNIKKTQFVGKIIH